MFCLWCCYSEMFHLTFRCTWMTNLRTAQNHWCFFDMLKRLPGSDKSCSFWSRGFPKACNGGSVPVITHLQHWVFPPHRQQVFSDVTIIMLTPLLRVFTLNKWQLRSTEGCDLLTALNISVTEWIHFFNNYLIYDTLVFYTWELAFEILIICSNIYSLKGFTVFLLH